MQKLLSLVIIISFVFIYSCSDNDDPVTPPETPTPLNAKAGLNQDAEIGETVTLDGSSSTGPSGFTYLWSYEGTVSEDQITFQNKTSAQPTFVPPVNGLYEFTLTITHSDSSDSDETTVLAGGAVELGGTLSENLELRNIQSDASKPDYIVKSDLIIPSGVELSITEDDVIIEFEPGTGINVSGGTITNETESQNESFRTEFSGTTGWKGIFVNNGTINLDHSLIVNAGNGKFENSDEPAAVTLSGTTTQLKSLSDNDFVNSGSYDIYVPNKLPEVVQAVMRNKLSYKIPIKAVITFMGFWNSDNPNLMPENFDYIHLIPSGADVKDEIVNVNGFSFSPSGNKYFIDGDFWAGSYCGVSKNNIIYFKEDCGWLPDGGLLSFATEDEPTTFTGINGAKWKGIGHRINSSFSLKHVNVINAGNGLINIGGLSAVEEAAIYDEYFNAVRLENCEISGSNGYGYYHSLARLTSGSISTTLFENCEKGGIYINLASVNLHLRENHGNIFNLDEGIPAVLLSEADLNPEGKIYGLGNGNYYLLNTDWEIYGDFKIEEGVYLKFTSGHYFRRGATSVVTWFEINGTQQNPVIFDGEAGTPGSWGGFLLEGYFRINHLVVKNGGEFLLPNATEKANIVSNYKAFNYDQQFLTNSEISNSAGWGIVVETDTWNFEFDASEKNNTFSNNVSGNILIK